ncbi:unnamed protein product, partial [Owenia fusiformis]
EPSYNSYNKKSAPTKERYEPSYNPPSYNEPQPSYNKPASYDKPRKSTSYNSPRKSAKSFDVDSYEPCDGKNDGDYVLSAVFRKKFPDVSPECAFVKCANYRTWLTPCGYGTKNNKYGKGYCRHLDLLGKCGKPPTKKSKKSRYVRKSADYLNGGEGGYLNDEESYDSVSPDETEEVVRTPKSLYSSYDEVTI